MYLFGKTLNYVIKAVITLITTLDTVYQRPWHLIGAGPSEVSGALGGALRRVLTLYRLGLV